MNGYIKQFIHVTIVEYVLGKKLPYGVIVHHFDGNKKNNLPSNLVVCPSGEYHALLHLRADALNACGNPAFRRCSYCKEYDSPENMYKHIRVTRTGERYLHRECRNKYKISRNLIIKGH